MNACYLIHRNGAPAVSIRRTIAIGDCVCASAVADKLSEQGYRVIYQTCAAIRPIIACCPSVDSVMDAGGVADANLDGAKEAEKENRTRHFAETFFTAANRQLRQRGIDLGPPINCRPTLHARANDVQAIKARLETRLRPWVFICPRSNSYNVRQVPDGVWLEAARRMRGSAFWLGTHPAPPGIVDLHCRDTAQLVPLLAAADLLVTVDTGPMHIAAALGVPVVAILQSSSPEMHLNDQRDWTMVAPPGLDCLHCMERLCPKSRWDPPCQHVPPDLIADAVNSRLDAYRDGRVSVVIPTYRAPDHRLNRCLQAVLDQVDEIIVTRDADGQLPAGAMQHPKIRYVQKRQARIGFGRNVNYGFRHTCHEWVCILNDDCYLNLGAIAELLRVSRTRPDIGIVTPLLRYPDGRIYVTCKVRQPGAQGWFHVDHRKGLSSFPNVTETENACGCCMFMRRAAFYAAGGFDEEFFMYAEDDDLSMRVRQAGWRILYAPNATGIHDEGQSSKLVPGILKEMQRSNAIVARKWGPYFEHNRNRVPLGDFSYLKA